MDPVCQPRRSGHQIDPPSGRTAGIRSWFDLDVDAVVGVQRAEAGEGTGVVGSRRSSCWPGATVNGPTWWVSVVVVDDHEAVPQREVQVGGQHVDVLAGGQARRGAGGDLEAVLVAVGLVHQPRRHERDEHQREPGNDERRHRATAARLDLERHVRHGGEPTSPSHRADRRRRPARSPRPGGGAGDGGARDGGAREADQLVAGRPVARRRAPAGLVDGPGERLGRRQARTAAQSSPRWPRQEARSAGRPGPRRRSAADVSGWARSTSAPCHERTASRVDGQVVVHPRAGSTPRTRRRTARRRWRGRRRRRAGAAARRSACSPSPHLARRSARGGHGSRRARRGRAGRAGAGRRCAAGRPPAHRWWARPATDRSSPRGRGSARHAASNAAGWRSTLRSGSAVGRMITTEKWPRSCGKT